MASKQVVFSDRIVGLSIQNGLVRVDLAMIAGTAETKDGKDALKLEVTHQLVMPLDAFVAGFNMQKKLVDELASRQQQQRSLRAPVPEAAGAAAESA